MERQRRREWRPSQSGRVGGRTALVCGTGPVGRAIARMLRAAGTRVSGPAGAALDVFEEQLGGYVTEAGQIRP